MEQYVFTSPRLPLIKAKQLQKAFPFLKLSAAQEATARALGYASWFDCSKLGARKAPSASDQQAGIDTRVARYYHQANVLMELGISAQHADVWVRGWGLTGSPTLPAAEAAPDYYRLLADALRDERGELSEAERVREYGEADWSKYPDVDRPVRICDGVVLAPCGKYPHYAVDPAVLARVPAYLRGASCRFHLEDDGHLLKMIVKDFPQDRATGYGDALNLVQHEWHHGEKHPDAEDLVVPQLYAAAMAAANKMVMISARFMPREFEQGTMGKLALACMRGSDFAEFIVSKGLVDPSKVVWYRDVEHVPRTDMYGWLTGRWPQSMLELPVFEEADRHEPSLPLYSYPFKFAPMASYEYYESIDRQPVLGLDQDYEADDDGGEWGDDGDSPGGKDGGDSAGPDLLRTIRTMDPALN